jgi:glucose/arabinose dehydrogenase
MKFPTLNPSLRYHFSGLLCINLFAQALMAAEVPEGVWVREGYTLSVAEDSIRKPRFMALDERGGMFVSVPSEGTIYRCEDKDGDGHYESKTTFLEGYESGKVLQGVQFYDGSLWCADMNHIYRATDRDQDGKAEEVKVIVGEDQLPITGGGHKWRALLIHQDRIYTHVGDQSNATDEPITENDRKKIWTFALDGSGKELFATGIRNTEKLVVRPGSDEIWGVDHDIDTLATKWESKQPQWGQPITDHNPPAELNHYVKGGFYGHPYILGKNMPNLNFLEHPDLLEMASKNIIPEWLFPAHCSGNGMCFYQGDAIPGAQGDAFVAFKGGWNATKKVGYRVSRILFDEGHPYGELKIVDFLKDGSEILGRPTDCIEAPDGSLLFSDDTGHRIYRLRASQP